MYREKTIAVVVPAFNEELLIERTLCQMPEFVDRIIVVDDASEDSTITKVRTSADRDPRICVISHPKNLGVGAAISSGYIWCREHGVDVAVVMAGDGQMDPADLPALIDPVVEDRTDYAKGNRLTSGEAWNKIPRLRYLGNSGLTFLTKIASGYWHVTDSQTGYTAISKRALATIPVETIFPRYGMPNDLLVTLNIFGLRVTDVPVKPVYGIGERSGIRLSTIIFSLSFLMARLFVKRMVQKYIIRDFHPLVLFYSFGLVLLLLDFPLAVRFFSHWRSEGQVPPINALALMFCTLMAFQSILFAMLFDMEANRHLRGDQ